MGKDRLISVSDDLVVSKIYHLRGKKIMLDRDLAEMYGVDTAQLKRQVKRNIDRFPSDFMFEMKKEELQYWRSQFGISNNDRMGLRYAPFCFTEQGVAMLSSVLNSKTAISVNIQIIRVFTRIREALLAHHDILKKMDELEKRMLEGGQRTRKNEEQIQVVFQALKQLIKEENTPRNPIGFRMKD